MGRLEHESELQHPPDQNAEEQSILVTKSQIPSPDPKNSAPKRKSSVARWLFWGFTFTLTATVSATLGAVIALVTPLSGMLASPQDGQQIVLRDLLQKGLRYQVTRPVNVLVMGIDEVLDLPARAPSSAVLSGRSDTMLLVRIDPESEAVNVLSIPRDTQIEIPGMGVTKVNHANVLGGPGLAARVVSRNLNNVPVDRYIRFNTKAFRELVDLLGGVEVFVPKDMQYVDQTQGLEIDLAQGWQTLNGDQAEQFARFRNDAYGDIGRVQRQQQIIRALRDRLTSPAVLPRLPQAIQLIQKYIDTNLTLEEMLALVGFGLELDQEDFRMVLLPGRFSEAEEFVASYWIVDYPSSDRVMQEYFKVGSVAMVKQERSLNRLRIAIQNASSEPHLGYEVETYLRDQGFDDVYVVQDWPDSQRRTEIIAQRGDLRGANLMESVLGLGQVVSASTGDLDSDLTIRVGDDWTQRPGI